MVLNEDQLRRPVGLLQHIEGDVGGPDYDILSSIQSSLGAANVNNVQYVIVFEATPSAAGLAPASAPSTACLTAAPGVLNTESHIAFRAYSKHDLEDAFAIGLPDAD